jgi:PAS domain S-box-containing protein
MLKNDIKKLLPSWILNSSTYSVSITDLEGKYIFINEVFYNRFSFVSDDFIGKSFEITMHQDDVEKAIQASLECIKYPDRHVKLYIRKPDIDNATFYWTHWEFSLFHDLSKNPIGILCLGHDVTVERMVQNQLRESESKLSAILDSTIHSNVFLSPDLKVIYFNRVATRELILFLIKKLK